MKPRYKIKASCYDKSGKLLASSENNYKKTHPIMAYLGKKVGQHPARICLHAEVSALLKCKDKRPYKIHVERYAKDGRPMLAKPCPICEEAIRMFGVSVVSYTTSGV